VVVHSAGIMPLLPISGGNVETFDKVIATNLRRNFSGVGTSGTARSRRGAHHRFLKQRHCKVLSPTYGPYIASKAGVEGLVRVLANELRNRKHNGQRRCPGSDPN